MKQKGILIVVSGFAGTGKGTIMKGVLAKYSEQYALSVSMTTRTPRPNETQGVEYFFTDEEGFQQKIREGGLIEYARYCDHLYGTPKDYVEKQLENVKDVLLEIEIQGGLQVKKKFPEAILVFVLPPNVEELYNRLKGRNTETDEVIRQRMLRAAEESEGIEQYDYILLNDDVDTCVECLHHMVQSEKMKASRNGSFIETIQKEFVDFKKGK